MFPSAAPSARIGGLPQCCARDASPLLLFLSAASCGEPPLRPRPPSEGAPHFTVMSYNIELGAAGESSTLDAVGEIDADIVCLQEVTPEAEAKLRASYAELYPYMLFKSKGG